MRKLTGSWWHRYRLSSAVIVFIFFPRGAGAGMIGPVEFKPTQALVGFNDEVSFQGIAQIQQNETVIATVHLSHNGQLVRGGTLLLRGVTVDSYGGKAGRWRWVRWPKDFGEDSPDDFSERRYGRMERPEPDERDRSLISQYPVSDRRNAKAGRKQSRTFRPLAAGHSTASHRHQRLVRDGRSVQHLAAGADAFDRISLFQPRR